MRTLKRIIVAWKTCTYNQSLTFIRVSKKKKKRKTL